MDKKRKTELTHTLILLVTAMLWGSTFAVQSIGAGYVGPFTYFAGRSWIAVLFLAFVVPAADGIRQKRGKKSGAPKNKKEKRALLAGGAICGLLLFLASVTQQIGIASTTAAKSSFITALYVILVPVISLFLGKRPGVKIWFCVALSLLGLYFLCMNGVEGLTSGDAWTLVCAVLFALQILSVDRCVKHVDGIRLSRNQILVSAVLSSVCMLFERPSLSQIRAALPSMLYAGILSSGAGYTLQIIGQEGLNPTVASLTMCMESVFGAVGGYFILGQVLTPKELGGCALMFAGIVLSQITFPERNKKKPEAIRHIPDQK